MKPIKSMKTLEDVTTSLATAAVITKCEKSDGGVTVCVIHDVPDNLNRVLTIVKLAQGSGSTIEQRRIIRRAIPHKRARAHWGERRMFCRSLDQTVSAALLLASVEDIAIDAGQLCITHTLTLRKIRGAWKIKL